MSAAFFLALLLNAALTALFAAFWWTRWRLWLSRLRLWRPGLHPRWPRFLHPTWNFHFGRFFWPGWLEKASLLLRSLPFWLGEISLLGLWAALIAWPYLNFDLNVLPAGREFSSYIQYHTLWTRLQQCGICALWNGSLAGGFPAFAELFGSELHPLVALLSLVFGALNGAKLALFFAFWLAGLAQWWLALEVNLGRAARLWSAALAMAAGHLTGRMEVGSFGMVFSTAFVSLLFPAMLAVIHGRGRRFTALLGILGALAILSGQGYFQVGFVFLLPAFLVLLFQPRRVHLWREYTLAFALAILLAAPLLLPFWRFSAYFSKGYVPAQGQDVLQPLFFIPFNLLIDNPGFYLNSTALGQKPFPSLYNNFIGWIPVLLAVLGASVWFMRRRRLSLYLAASIVLAWLVGSAEAFPALAKIFPWMVYIRFSAVITGLAVPFLLLFAAGGVDFLMNRLPAADKSPGGQRLKRIDWRWAFLPLLAFSLFQTYSFSRNFVQVETYDPEMYALLSALRTDRLEWVNPPFGEQYFAEPAARFGLKLSPGIAIWKWNDREAPAPYLEFKRDASPLEEQILFGQVFGVRLYRNPQAEYARVEIAGQPAIACAAQGLGGHLEVTCDTPQPGVLTVRENLYPGWNVSRNGQPAALKTIGPWLMVDAPAGHSRFVFDYLPWDVPAGVGLSLLGLTWAAFLFFSPRRA